MGSILGFWPNTTNSSRQNIKNTCMTLKYILIKSFFAEFSYEIYEVRRSVSVSTIRWNILTQHPKNQYIENQSGATAFFTSNAFKRTTPSKLC